MPSDSSQWVSYKGCTLKPNSVYYWRVKVKTNRGKSKWSEWRKWTTGLLSKENWQGQWIGYDSITPDVRMERHSRIAARHLRKTFSVHKPVKRATAHICGLGYYLLHINGQRIGDYLLAPAPTQYDKAAIYDTYDVTEQCIIHNAQCIIEVVLAGGYFFPMTQNYQTNVRSAYGMPKLKLNLIVEYEDGTSETIATDNTSAMLSVRMATSATYAPPTGDFITAISLGLLPYPSAWRCYACSMVMNVLGSTMLRM